MSGSPTQPATRCAVVVACPGTWQGARESVASALAQPGVEVLLCTADEATVRSQLGDLAVTVVAHDVRSALLGSLCEAGLRASTAPFVVFLPAGDRLEPRCIERQLEHCVARPEIDVVFARAVAAEETAALPDRPVGKERMLAALLRGRPWPLATGLIRRASLLEVGGLDPAHGIVPECDLWLRLLARGGIAIADEASVKVRWPRPGMEPEVVAAERGVAVARLVDRFGSRWRGHRGDEEGLPARATRARMRLDLAAALLRSEEIESGPLAQRLIREARRRGAAFPDGAPFDELRYLHPRLADVEYVERGDCGDRTGMPDGPLPAGSPLAGTNAERGRARLVVAVAVETEEDLRYLDRRLAWWRGIDAAGDVEIVAVLPRPLVKGLDRWNAAGVHIEPLERLAWGDREAQVMLERVGADVVLAPANAATRRAAELLGIPCGPALARLMGEDEWTATRFASHLEDLVCESSCDDPMGEIAALRAELAAERQARRSLARLAADLEPGLDVVEGWMVRPVLREGPFRKLAAMSAEADAVRSLGERIRDLAERTHEKLRIGRRLRSSARALLGRKGMPRRLRAFSGAPLEVFLERLRDRPETWLWVIYTTDPYSELRGQRSTWIARELLRRGHAIVFCYWRWSPTEPISGSASPDLLPLPIDQLRAAWPILAALARPAARKLFLIEFPDQALFELLGLANASGFVTLYDCIDDWQEFARGGQARWYDEGVERLLAAQCDVVLATHPLLRDRLARLAGREAELVPNGYDPSSLEDRRRAGQAARAHPIVGYFGHLSDAWFDWELLRETARRRPDLRFELIGYGEPSGLEVPGNVRLLGAVPHDRLADHAVRWDVAIVPFRIGALTRAVDPIKVYEYLALGLPVVAVGMPHLVGTPGVAVCDRSGFAAALDEARRASFDERAVGRYLDGSEWRSRVDRILKQVARADPYADVLKVLAG